MTAPTKPTVPPCLPSLGRSPRFPTGWWILPGIIIGGCMWWALIRFVVFIFTGS